jgi:hypothetical protein
LTHKLLAFYLLSKNLRLNYIISQFNKICPQGECPTKDIVPPKTNIIVQQKIKVIVPQKTKVIV